MSDAIANKRIGRRTIAKGAAWTVPAIAVAAPAASAAVSEPIAPEFVADSFCKHSSGGQGCDYHTVIKFTNTSTEDIELTLGTMTRVEAGGSMPARFSVASAYSATYTVPAGQVCSLYVDAGRFTDCTNTTVNITYSYLYGGEVISSYVEGPDEVPQGNTPCGTNPAEDEPSANPPHGNSGPNPVCTAITP